MLRSIGCHRDLKPSNVLIDGTRLILADFGLAKMTGDHSTSQSIQPTNRGDCIAPECQDMYDEGFEFKKVGRAGDVWSLGCILLLLLVLRSNGVRGVLAFNKSRELVNDGIRRRRFHDQHNLAPGIDQCMDNLREAEDGAIVCKALLPLIRSMLSISPIDRPKARTVMIHLQRTTLARLCSVIRRQFMNILGRAQSTTHVHVELQIFRGWQFACRLDVLSSNLWPPPAESPGMSLQEFHGMIESLRRASDALGGPDKDKQKISLQALRHEIDLMINELSDEQRHKAEDYTERALLDYRGEQDLASIRDYQQSGSSSHTMALASLELASKRQLVLDPDEMSRAVISMDRLGHRTHVRDQLYHVMVKDRNGDGEVPSLMEERKPSPLQTSSGQESLRVFRDRVQRLQKVAQLLRQATATPSLHTLSCSGLYYDEIRLYSGLLYDFPIKQSRPLRSFTTLHDLLTSPQSPRLSLGQRFTLAWTLASSLYEVHKVSWMHRRISASNVIYFHDPEQGLTNIDINNFHSVGFAQSRPVEQYSDTDGHSTADDPDGYYQHPTYRDSTNDFQSAFDYYAFGILLLEIGHGKLLPALCRNHGTSIASAGRSGFQALIDELAFACGDEFRRAAEACVKLEIMKQRKRGLKGHEGPEIEKNFREGVLRRLDGCKNAGI